MVPELITLCDVEGVLPPLSLDEYNGLCESIKAEGILTPLIIWNNTIIDGHHRYKIAKELNIPFQTVEKPFESLDEAKMWIIQNQGSRRNINAYTRVMYALRLKESIAEKYRSIHYGTPDSSFQNSGTTDGCTDKEIARIANVSHDTVHRVNYLAENADEETKKKLQNGEMSINHAYTQTRAEKATKIPTDPVGAVLDGDDDTFFSEFGFDDNEANTKDKKNHNPCVTLKMINRVDPRSLVNVLFSLFDQEFRSKLIEMLLDEMMKSDGPEKTVSLVIQMDKKFNKPHNLSENK